MKLLACTAVISLMFVSKQKAPQALVVLLAVLFVLPVVDRYVWVAALVIGGLCCPVSDPAVCRAPSQPLLIWLVIMYCDWH